jgi:hypothetical protein
LVEEWPKKEHFVRGVAVLDVLFILFFDHKDGGSTFLQSVSESLKNYIVWLPRRQYFL